MAIAMLLFLAASCQKEHDGLYQGDNSGASGKQLVATFNISYSKNYYNYSLNFTSGDVGGTKLIWSGRNLKGVSWMDYENGTWIDEGGQTLSYDGDSPTEIRMEQGDEMVTYYITYADGYPTEIYAVYEDGDWERTTYRYDSGGKIRTSTRINDAGNSFSSTFTWTGDNLTYIEEHESTGSVYYTNYTYDSKKSLYSSISLPLKLIICEGDFSVLSANNVILEQYTHTYTFNGSTSTSTNTYAYAYTYDGDYPVKCIRTEHGTYDEYGYKKDRTRTTYYEYADGTGASQMPRLYTLGVERNNTSWGYVSGGGVYAAGTEAVISADANYTYDFLQWNDGNTSNPRYITVNSDATYTAIFGY